MQFKYMDIALKYLFAICIIGLSDCQIQGDYCHHSCNQKDKCTYKRFQDVCVYLFANTRKTWDQNKEFCNDQSMQMVEVTSALNEKLSHPIFKNSNFTTYGSWLAGRAFDLGKWKFLNDTDTDMLKKNEELQNFNNHHHCGYIRVDSLAYGAHDCTNRNSSICRYNNHDTGHFWYLELIKEQKTWFEARWHCIQKGGDLFHMKTGDDEIYLHGLIQEKLPPEYPSYLHVGIVHRVWKWHDESLILFTNWEVGEPSHPNEDCLMMYSHNGKWNDAYCYETKPALCQKAMKLTTYPTKAPTTKITSPQTVKSGQSSKAPSTTETSFLHNGTSESSLAATEASQIVLKPEKLSVIIILGTLLGVFFLISLLLLVYVIILKRNKSVDEPATLNPYGETISRDFNSPPRSASNGAPRALDNDYTVVDEPSQATATSTKPIIKPQHVIGPVNGDVYTTIEKAIKPSK